jgi:hypothetical protein
MAITIDDLAGPNGPGPAKSKGDHWKVEPGYGWWGPGDGFDDGFDNGFLSSPRALLNKTVQPSNR